MHFEDPDGLLYPRIQEDDIATNDLLSAQLSNLAHTIAMQAHGQMYVSGPGTDNDIKVGPDQVMKIISGDVGVLQFNPQIDASAGSVEDTIARELKLRGVSPANATADPKYMPALSLKVINQTQYEHRQARIPFAREMEERRLWPVVRAVLERYAGMQFPDEVRLRVFFGEVERL